MHVQEQHSPGGRAALSSLNAPATPPPPPPRALFCALLQIMSEMHSHFTATHQPTDDVACDMSVAQMACIHVCCPVKGSKLASERGFMRLFGTCRILASC